MKRLDNELAEALHRAILGAEGAKTAGEIERETGVSYKTVQKHAAMLGVELARRRGVRRIAEPEYESEPEEACEEPGEAFEDCETEEPGETFEPEERPRRREIAKCPKRIDVRAGELFAALSEFFGKIAEIFRHERD